MSEAEGTDDVEADLNALRERNSELERRLDEVQASHAQRLVRAELKAEAVRAGMIDLDGLKLIEPDTVGLDDQGEVHGARAAVSRLRRDKPWLFTQLGSSSTAAAPPSSASTAKLATDMSLEEWRVARAELLRRR